MNQTLQHLKDEMNEYCASWNGKEAGAVEETAHIANEIIEHLEAIEKLLPLVQD